MYRHPIWQKYVLYCHKVWPAPVHIPHVTEYVRMLLSTERVAKIWFDPMQWAAEAQHLEEEGHGRKLEEVNQGQSMVMIGTNLFTPSRS